MGDGILYRRAYPVQVIRQILTIQVRTNCHHSAAYVNADCSGYYRALGRNDAPHRRAHTPVAIRHNRDVFVEEWQARHVVELGEGLGLKLHAASPRLDGMAEAVAKILRFKVFKILRNHLGYST